MQPENNQKTKLMLGTAKLRLRYLISPLFIFITFYSNAQVLSGKITDEQNHPVPYATIFVKETQEGTTSNIDGNFQFQLTPGSYHLTVRSMGYLQQEKTIKLNRDSVYLPIVMQVQKFELKEVKVFPGKEDPAYFIMRKAIAKAPYFREKIKHYVADLYLKANFEFTNIPNFVKKQEVEDGKKFKDYFKENVTYVIESQNKITFDYPNHYDQKVIHKRTSLVGIDEPPVMGLMTTSFYQERPEQMISPLSSQGLKHYDFRYEGFITVGDLDVFKIKVSPKRKSDELVDGYIYIVDRLWCIYNLDFSSTFEFVEYRIKQQFEKLGNENWLPVSHNINGNIGILGMRGSFYYGASVKYDSIVDNYTSNVIPEVYAEQANETQQIEEDSEKTKQLKKEVELITAKEELSNADVKKASRLNRKILKQEYKDSTRIVSNFYTRYKIENLNDSLREEISWDTIRAIPLTPAEVVSYQIADSLRTIESPETDTLRSDSDRRRSALSKVAFGHYDLCKDSLVRLSYGGLLSIENFGFNAVDGYKYKQFFQFRYNPDSAKYLYITPELGYTFNRKVWFGSLNIRLVNLLGYGNTTQIKAGKESRDFKSEYGIDPNLNAISTWFFAKNYMKLYETEFAELKSSQRLDKNFSAGISIAYNHFYPLENHAGYLLGKNKDFEPNVPGGRSEDDAELQEQKSFSYSAGISYFKHLLKPWLEESPFLFFNDFISAKLSYKQGLKGVFSSVSDYSQIDFTLHHQANISPTSGIDWKINVGYFPNYDQLHFSEYKHFQTAEIPVTFSPFTNTLQLLNDYEISSKKGYINISGEYRSEYILLRYLSLINRKTWSESLHLNYFSRDPVWENYLEAGYSINNLFFIGNFGVFTGIANDGFQNVSVKLSISIND